MAYNSVVPLAVALCIFFCYFVSKAFQLACCFSPSSLEK